MIYIAIEFFFSVIRWVFNDFLLSIVIFEIPLLYWLIALGIAAILINALLSNSSAAFRKIKVSKNKGSVKNGSNKS